MATNARHDAWQAGDSYDLYMGRWSRPIAAKFLRWLDLPKGLHWLEIGCGTGALTSVIVEYGAPASVIAIEPSSGFLETARKKVADPRVDFRQGDASNLSTMESGSRDVAVAGLVLNFISDRVDALAEMKRIVRPGGTVAFYVWDYPGGGVEFMRAFWKAASVLDPAAADLTEDKRFPFCTRDGLVDIARQAGLSNVEITALESPTVFASFDDYWHPFTLGAGPAPGYCASLPPDARERLEAELSRTLPRQDDGSIVLNTRAWAVRGRVD